MAREIISQAIKLPKDDLARLVRETTVAYEEYNEQRNLSTKYRAEAAKWTALADKADLDAATAWEQTQAKAKAMSDEIIAAEQPVVPPEDPTAPGFVDPVELGSKAK